jgi:head-tail adaptor
MKLNWRCTVERKSTTRDSNFGTAVIVWVTQCTTWVNVQDVLPSRSSEAVSNNLATVVQKVRVRMRRRTDIDSSMRLVINRPTAKTYQIVAGPAELDGKKYIEFLAEEFTL